MKLSLILVLGAGLLAGCSSTYYSDRLALFRTEEPKKAATMRSEMSAALSEVPGLQVTEVQHTDDWQGFVVKLRYFGQSGDVDPFQAADASVLEFANALAPYGYIAMRAVESTATSTSQPSEPTP